MNSSYVIHLPHSGTEIPSEYIKDYYLDSKELENNIFQYADYKTDELYSPFTETFEDILNPYSRLFVDPERFFDDNQESMQIKYGLGWFYENAILDRKPLRSTQNKEKVKEYYLTHHKELLNKVEKQLSLHNRCTIIDCHSFSNERYWFHDKNLNLPDICIGFDEYHKDEKLVEAILDEFKDYDIGVNIPYAGSLVPSQYYIKDSRVKSVMIEINKKLYLEEGNITKNNNFNIIKNKIENIKNRIV